MSIMKKRSRITVSVLLSLTMILCSLVFAGSAGAVTNATTVTPPSEGPDYSYTGTIYAYGGGDSASTDAWTSWKGVGSNTFYLFLPSAVDRDVYFWNSFTTAITVTNANNSSDTFTLQPGLNGPIAIGTTKTYTVKNGSTTLGTLKFKLSEAEGSIFISTTDSNYDYQDNWNYICQDKENKSKGRYVISDDTGYAKTGTLKHIKGRGNSTWSKSKKPFNINLDEKDTFFGMNSSKKYSLLANYQEGTLMRNRLLYDMADELGLSYSPDSRFVDFYVNGSYKGSYQMSEKVELGKNYMVKITDLASATEKAAEAIEGKGYDVYGIYGTSDYEVSANYNGGKIYYYDIPAQYNPTDITGGYLIEYDTAANSSGDWNKFRSPSGQWVTVKGPEYCTEAQMKYIFDYVASVENAVYNKLETYSDLIDVESVAKSYLIQEFSKNIDGGITSTYFFKDSDTKANGKLQGGPVWDFDCGLGNLYGSRTSPSGTTYNTNEATGWFNRYIAMADNANKVTLLAGLAEIDTYWDAVVDIWNNEFTEVIAVANGEQAATGSRLKSIAEYQAYLTKSAEMNYVINPFPYYNNNGDFTWIPCTSTTFAGHVTFLTNWMNTRATWIDANIDVQPPAQDTVYYDNSVTNWYTVYAYAWNNGGGNNASWPGVQMTGIGNNILSVTMDHYDNIIFTNGSAQTVDLVNAGNGKVFKSTGLSGGKYIGTWSDYAPPATMDIYFDNQNTNWTTIYASYWGGGASQTWPGTLMTHVSGSVYKVSVPEGCTSIIFNNGGNGKQTGTLTPLAGQTYLSDGIRYGYDSYGNELYGGTWVNN